MKVVRRRVGRAYQTVAINDNGRQEVIVSRTHAKVREDAEERLLRALARRLGYSVVRAEAWRDQLRVAERAHAALMELRRVLAAFESDPRPDAGAIRLHGALIEALSKDTT